MNIRAGTAYNADTNIYYEVLGRPAHESLILISGLGSQLVYWTDELCQVFVDRNFQVVRFDNRDVGLSSKTSGPAQPVSEILRSEAIDAMRHDLMRFGWDRCDAIRSDAILMGSMRCDAIRF